MHSLTSNDGFKTQNLPIHSWGFSNAYYELNPPFTKDLRHNLPHCKTISAKMKTTLANWVTIMHFPVYNVYLPE
jgi:hypothetical protein